MRPLLCLLLVGLAPSASAQELDDPKLGQQPAPIAPLNPTYETPPPGYPPPKQQQRFELRRPNYTMIISGLAAFAGLWLGSSLAGYLAGDGVYAIPIGGPIYGGFRQIDRSRSCGYPLCGFLEGILGFVSVLDGVLAGAALGVAIAGLFVTRKVPIQAAIAPAPGGATLALGGVF